MEQAAAAAVLPSQRSPKRVTDTDLAQILRTRLAAARTHGERVVVLAEKTDLSPNQASELLERCGSDLDHLIDEAVAFKAEG